MCPRYSANASGGATLSYDPLGQLGQLTVSGQTTRLLYSDGQLAAEYSGAGALLRRHIPGAAFDETIATLDSSGRTFILPDVRGTPMALVYPNGAVDVEHYDSFGIEASGTVGRFGFTGQMRLPELQLAYYKNRMYDPAMGRFLSPDPLGYVDGPNLYAYTLNDPINNVDPWGLQTTCTLDFSREIAQTTCTNDPIVVPGVRDPRSAPPSFFVFVSDRTGFTGPATPPSYGGSSGGRGPKEQPGPPQDDSIEDATFEFLAVIPAAGAVKVLGFVNKLRKLSKAGRAADRNGLTKAGRALQKKTDRANSAFSKSGTRAAERNSAGQKELNDILYNPRSTVMTTKHGSVIVTAPNGKGAIYNPDGSFRGFLEP